jgi:hypothetical protein
MMTRKGLSWLVLAALLLTGPLGPLGASAQIQPPTQGPPPTQMPPPPPMPPASTLAPIPPPPMQLPPPVPPAQFLPAAPSQGEPGQVGMWGEPVPVEPTQGDAIGAGFMNVVYVPGKAILCGAGTVMATFLMLVTFGNAYPTASGLFKEGCHGTWVLTADHVSGKIPPDWVRTDGYQSYYPHGGIYP